MAIGRQPALVPCAVAVAALAGLAWWLTAAPPTLPAAPRLPGADHVPASAAPAVKLSGTFAVGPGSPAALPGAWPGFRGADGRNVAVAPAAPGWPPDGPRRCWRVTVGDGYAGAAVWSGRVYLLDYDLAGQADVVRCLSLADGRELWRRGYSVKVKRNHGMSRTVPAVNPQGVVTFGPKGHVVCLDPVTGDFRWGVDLVREYRCAVPAWYSGQCPLIDGDRVILAPAGPTTLLVALELKTGEVVWRTPNPQGWQQSHTSVVPMTLGGRRTYVYAAQGGVAGVDAANGELVWSTDQWKVQIATVPSPLVVGPATLLLTGGYGSGAALLQLDQAGGQVVPRVIRRFQPDELGSDQQTPILADGRVYCVLPGGQLGCFAPDGRELWRSGAAQRFGLGPYLLVGDRLLLLNDTGRLTLAAVGGGSLQAVAAAQVLDGHDSWGPLALAGDRLLLRDLTTLACYQLGERTP